jgi:3-oxoacyl-[acyl-carrier protein] reductase
VLVNNAGIIHSEPLVNILSRTDTKHSLENWRKTIDINLNAVFYVTSHVVEKMVKSRSKGVIINISSISSYGNMGQSAYSASKAALNALTVTWSKELGMFGIRCVAIAPGFIDTPSTQAALSEVKIKSYKNATPLGRFGKTEELLHAVIFIIENDFYNGTILNLDGGLKIYGEALLFAESCKVRFYYSLFLSLSSLGLFPSYICVKLNVIAIKFAKPDLLPPQFKVRRGGL